MENDKPNARMKVSQKSRKFWQYISETIWAIGAGALVAPVIS